LTISVINSAIDLLTPDTTICYGNSAGIRLQGSPTMNYSWAPASGLSNPFTQDPIATPPVFTSYTVTATSPGGLCTSSASLKIDVANPTAVILTKDTTICTGSSLDLIVAGDSSEIFSWTPVIGLSGANIINPVAAPNVKTTYVLTATVAGTICSVSRDVTIDIKSAALSNVTPNRTIRYGTSVQLNADSSLYFMWTPDDGSLNNPNINNPVATPLVPTTYTVYGTDIHGCRASASINVDLFYDNMFIPDAFSPNNDGLNDIFRVGNLGNYKLVEMSVFNRWGSAIYHVKDGDNKGWDGSYNGVPQDMGVYNYMIVVNKPDGTLQYYKGTVTLIR
jgi:gliding motility-associated-like protein